MAMTILCAGNKMNNVDVVYTMWSNLKKTPSMDVGQVGFHRDKEVSSVLLLPLDLLAALKTQKVWSVMRTFADMLLFVVLIY